MKITKNCIICYKDFIFRKFTSTKGTGRFCSSKCYGEWMKNNKQGEKSHNWHGGKRIHAAGYIWVYSPTHPLRDKRDCVLEHRLIMEKKLDRYLLPTEEVDHINHIRNDNNPDNLRLSTSSQNKWNASKHKDNTSGFKGVHLDKKNNKYMAYITKNYHRTHLGYFIDKDEAARAYNKAAIKLFGEYAYINKI